MLRLLTLNTGLTEIRLFGAALYEDVPHVPVRAAHLAPALREMGADIVLLQELVPQRVKKALAAELRDLYPHSAGIAEDSRFYGTGLLTLSRHPMEEARCTSFKRQTFEEGLFGPRGMLSCTVRTPELGRIRVVNLHVTAGGAYRQRRRKGTPDLRSAQIGEAIDDAGAPFDGPGILAGDFNCDPAAVPALDKQLTAAQFGDAAASTPAVAHPQGTWDPQNPLNRARAAGPARRVDHIFLRPGGERPVTVASAGIVLDEPMVPLPGSEALPLSDHYGLLATLAPA